MKRVDGLARCQRRNRQTADQLQLGRGQRCALQPCDHVGAAGARRRPPKVAAESLNSCSHSDWLAPLLETLINGCAPPSWDVLVPSVIALVSQRFAHQRADDAGEEQPLKTRRQVAEEPERRTRGRVLKEVAVALAMLHGAHHLRAARAAASLTGCVAPGQLDCIERACLDSQARQQTH